VNPDLHAFVREALARGTSRDDVRKALRDARWPEDEIEAELEAWHDAGLGLPVPRRRLGFSPREAFLYLLLFVALYLVAFNVGSILFFWIERLWPDAAMSGSEEYWDRTRDGVRFAISCVLVAFPVYLYTAGPVLASHVPLIAATSTGVVAGTFVGVPVLRRVPENTYRQMIGLLLVVLGAALIVMAM